MVEAERAAFLAKSIAEKGGVYAFWQNSTCANLLSFSLCNK